MQVGDYRTVTAGSERHIGRLSFPDLLGTDTSSDHLTIGVTERNESTGLRDAEVVITDHSENGTGNVTMLSHFAPYPGVYSKPWRPHATNPTFKVGFVLFAG